MSVAVAGEFGGSRRHRRSILTHRGFNHPVDIADTHTAAEVVAVAEQVSALFSALSRPATGRHDHLRLDEQTRGYCAHPISYDHDGVPRAAVEGFTGTPDLCLRPFRSLDYLQQDPLPPIMHLSTVPTIPRTCGTTMRTSSRT